MKHRTFLTTLALFLFFFNLGIFIVSDTMFRDTLKNAQERSLGEHYFIITALSKDFQAVESRGTKIKDSIPALLQPYTYLSGEQKVALAFFEGQNLIYGSKEFVGEESRILQFPQEGNRLTMVRKIADQTYTIVIGRLPEPYSEYTLAYFCDITEGIASWNHLKNKLFLAGLILSAFLACGLLLVLNRLFRPLQEIAQTSKEIAKGEYATRLPVYKEEELGEMAQSFNQMAEEIQRQMLELKETAAKKQQFVDNFAHELRTPLTAIHGYAEYLQKAVTTEEDRQWALSYIMAESRRLENLATQLLEMANLQNNPVNQKNQLQRQRIEVSSLFDKVRKSLYGKLVAKEIKLEFHQEIEEIWGEPSLLESLLINLLDNSIKACEQGGQILVKATWENGLKTLSVQDNGKGMTPEVLAQIREPFFRGEKSRNRKDGGAGLGLAICQEIVLLHGGELLFTSEPGQGTIAKVIFQESFTSL
jgi:two-component system OmpR family sensor kinase